MKAVVVLDWKASVYGDIPTTKEVITDYVHFNVIVNYLAVFTNSPPPPPASPFAYGMV